MQNIKYAILFLISFLTAFLFAGIIKFFLPAVPVEHSKPNFNENYYNINLSKIFINDKTASYNTQNSNSNVNSTLKGITLKAVYNDGKKAFIVIQDGKKTAFVDLNGTYKGYKLVKINPTSAIFEKNGKKYIIKFGKDKKNYTYKKESQTNFTLKKSTVMEYKKNPAKIWNNIGIVKYKRGYKITYVKPNSIFDKIGLKKGDIILQVNSKELSNDAQAWQIYQNIDKYDSLDIEIERNNKLKVIHYEMD